MPIEEDYQTLKERYSTSLLYFLPSLRTSKILRFIIMLIDLVFIFKQKCHAQSIKLKRNKLHIHIFVPLGMSMEFPKH